MTNGEAVNWIINISADIGKVEHKDLWHYEQALSEIRDILESTQPRKGKWIKEKDGYNRCSECGSRGSAIKARYCHHCGAYMRGEQE